MAWLSLSEPHEVKMTSLGSHSTAAATDARAAASASAHGRANAWPLLGLPKCSHTNGSMAAATSGKIGVVAL